MEKDVSTLLTAVKNTRAKEGTGEKWKDVLEHHQFGVVEGHLGVGDGRVRRGIKEFDIDTRSGRLGMREKER